MRNFSYFLMKIRYRLKKRDHEVISNYFRKAGMTIGKNCNIVSNINTSEPYLITIGNNVTISADVTLVTHDNCISKIDQKYTDLFGRIAIGDNCFIGNRAMILYGVSIADNVIVAAGSIVTKSITKNNIIVAGNPAKEIGTWEAFLGKYGANGFNLNDIDKRKLVETILGSNKLIEK